MPGFSSLRPCEPGGDLASLGAGVKSLKGLEHGGTTLVACDARAHEGYIQHVRIRFDGTCPCASVWQQVPLYVAMLVRVCVVLWVVSVCPPRRCTVPSLSVSCLVRTGPVSVRSQRYLD